MDREYDRAEPVAAEVKQREDMGTSDHGRGSCKRSTTIYRTSFYSPCKQPNAHFGGRLSLDAEKGAETFKPENGVWYLPSTYLNIVRFLWC